MELDFLSYKLEGLALGHECYMDSAGNGPSRVVVTVPQILLISPSLKQAAGVGRLGPQSHSAI